MKTKKILILICIFITPIIEASDSSFSFISRWAGAHCYSVEVNDNCIFMSKGGYADIFNKSNCDSLSRIEVPSYITEMVASDSLLFLSTDKYGIFIYDITNVLNPVKVGVYQTQARIETFKIKDRFLYCATTEGLIIINIVDIQNPAFAASYNTGYKVFDLDFKDEYLYVTEYAMVNSGFIILNISNPSNPVFIKKVFSYFSYCNSLSVYNNKYLYISCLSGGIIGYSLEDPSNPVISCPPSGYNGYKIYIKDSVVYQLDTGNDLILYNISNSDSISFLTKYVTPGDPKNIRVDKNLLLIADSYDGLLVYDNSDILNPDLIKHIASPGSTDYLYVDGNYAYLSNYGLWIIDLTDLHHPREVGSFNYLHSTGQIYKKDSIVYMIRYLGISILDVKNSSHPYEVSTIPFDVMYNFRVDGNYIFICGNNRLEIWDIHNVYNPTIVKTIQFQHPVRDLVIKGNYLIASEAALGVLIYDISDILNPYVVSSLLTDCSHLAIENDILVSSIGKTFRVIDLNNIFNPVMKYSRLTENYINDMFISENIVYLFNSVDGVSAYDLRDSSFVTKYDTDGYAWSGDLSGNYLFVADTYGMDIIRKDFVTSVNESTQARENFRLNQNFPNPFNPNTIIEFEIPFTSQVSLKIYDALGNEIITLLDKSLSKGIYQIDFDGSNYASGIYICCLLVEKEPLVRKMLLVK